MKTPSTAAPTNHAHTPTEAGRPDPGTPQSDFHSIRYQTINARRLEHLASLRLPIAGRSVLEVGAGIGDLTGFFVDRGCEVTSTEGRDDNIALLRRRWEDHPRVSVSKLDLDPPPTQPMPVHDIVFCYGLLYHVSDPGVALRFLAESCGSMLLLETQASFGEQVDHVPWHEDAALATSARSGDACRPTRPWLAERLSGLFEHVYFAATRPLHNEFPTAWTPEALARTPRVIMVASREPIECEDLSTDPPVVLRDMD
jgi:hypothetical protein